MLEYRAYLLDQNDHIKYGIDLICENDEEAKERAKHLGDGHDVELCLGTKTVAKFRYLRS